ncbi:uncharacterized protein I303_100959 [Kwoniella dejecticola CBS 10117]|uniref:Uncharacterized protein n=1 Tax=Kwoniella dejecticola CBS 10117 TaxID=1296121 RepID=A0AAJ8KHE7_9TREE
MKRSYSSDEDDSSPPTTPSPSTPHHMIPKTTTEEIKPKVASTPKKKTKGTHTSKSPMTPKKETGSKDKNNAATSPCTPDKKEKFMERIFTLGLKACNHEEICQEFGLTKVQFSNATQAGKRGNLRDKACKGIRGD